MIGKGLPVVAVALTATILCSCGEGERTGGIDRVPTYPVKTEIFLNGEPVEGVTAIMHPKNAEAGTHKPIGVVQADGSVRWTTYEPGDGAPAGEYDTTFFWKPPQPYGGVGFGAGGGSRSQADRLGGKYDETSETDWSWTITEGENDTGRVELEVDPAVIEEAEGKPEEE